MALLFMDGFDKYGGLGNNSVAIAALMTQGEWNSFAGSNSAQIVAGLSPTGFAVQVGSNMGLSKTLAGNYGRLIGGMRFSVPSLAVVNGITFNDTSSNQCSITINVTTGTFSVRTGGNIGTAIGTSGASITTNTTHYLEWDITFAASGAYQLWLDGVSILSGTGNTKTTANNYANTFIIVAGNTSSGINCDDLYLFDTTGTTNNAVLLTSPRIETQFPTSDGAIQFAPGAATLGTSAIRYATTNSGGANFFYVRPYTPTRACTLNSLGLISAVTNATLNIRPVVYADNAGTPTGGALLSSGSTVTGITAGAITTLPLTTPLTLTAGTQYWLGWMSDLATTSYWNSADGNNSGRTQTVTFTSGAPSTGPGSLFTGQFSAPVFGNITLTSPINTYEVNQNPAQGLPSYVYDATVGHEDFYNFPNLTVAPTAIYAVAVKGNVAKSDAGAKTVSLRTKSGGTDSGGSLTGQAPGTSFTWLTSLFVTDPNTSAAWTGANLNAAQSGFRIDS